MTYKKDYVETLEKHASEMRSQNERLCEENERLCEENERLQSENYRLRDITDSYDTGLLLNFAYNKVIDLVGWFKDER